ncbi:MAG: precorrin-3B synthase [Methylobacteriaceae bacterium]|nr:precorrin-3B synthase [Methylobacteriaceae bacterium]
MSAAPQIKGWCPSAWRPMLSGDGYLVRLRFSCGILSSEQARAIAALAQRYGNGVIDLTRRANLQIRGIAEERIPGLQTELLAGNLIGSDAGDIPAVIASPLAGRDRDALIDIRPLVRELEAHLAADSRARDLPAKFCIAVEDGGRLSLQDVGVDIAFEACCRHTRIGFAVRIGGEHIGFIETDNLAETALTLAAAFCSLRTRQLSPARRMRDLVEEVGTSSITASCPALSRASGHTKAQRHKHAWGGYAYDGVGPITEDVFGLAAPFGSFSGAQLALLADVAAVHAEGELRLTPWRAVLIPAIAAGAIDRVAAECARAGLITDACDPRRYVAACPGAPACPSASVATRQLATLLGPLLRSRDTLHVSGCSKGCASSAASSLALIGREGRYDLVRNGTAKDTPVLFGLSPEDVCLAVKRITTEDLAHV